jgi:hypothetical protein
MPKLFRSYCRADSHDSTSFKKDEDMGLGPNWGRDDGFSSAPYVAAEVRETRIPKVQQLNTVEGNPNPKNFRILQSERIGRFVILLVNYPDCNNFEGDKILVFEGVSVDELQSLTSLDPHFCDSKVHPSPLARFVPTLNGWVHATKFCKNT